MSLLTYIWDGSTLAPATYDYADSAPPWAYADATAEAQFTAGWPVGTEIVDLVPTGSNLEAQVVSTLNTVPGGVRVVIRLPQGVFHLTDMVPRGGSGNVLYAFALWQPRLQGFVGAGPDKTVIQLDVGSIRQTQLDQMATLTKASFSPLNMGMIRLDATPTSPALMAGLTIRAADQPLLTQVAADVDITVPQPAPHHGLVLYSDTPGSPASVQYVRFQGAGRACMSQPPFEMANITSSKLSVTLKRCEIDGRRSPDLDATMPRRCVPIMGNNESSHTLEECWLHHSNVNRYAINDQNAETFGPYTLTRVKSDHMADTQNVDPVYGNLRGYAVASSFGWEDVAGAITLRDPIINIDNSDLTWGGGKHLDLTTVSARNPIGGRMYVYGGTFRCPWPGLDGFLLIRPHQSTHWWTAGLSTTIHVYDFEGGTRKTPWRWESQAISGTAWPPAPGWLASQGITPATHYVVRTA